MREQKSQTIYVSDPNDNWSRSVCGEFEEILSHSAALSHDAPDPLGIYVNLNHFVDSNLMHDIMTGRSVTGIKHATYGLQLCSADHGSSLPTLRYKLVREKLVLVFRPYSLVNKIEGEAMKLRIDNKRWEKIDFIQYLQVKCKWKGSTLEKI